MHSKLFFITSLLPSFSTSSIYVHVKRRNFLLTKEIISIKKSGRKRFPNTYSPSVTTNVSLSFYLVNTYTDPDPFFVDPTATAHRSSVQRDNWGDEGNEENGGRREGAKKRKGEDKKEEKGDRPLSSSSSSSYPFHRYEARYLERDSPRGSGKEREGGRGRSSLERKGAYRAGGLRRRLLVGLALDLDFQNDPNSASRQEGRSERGGEGVVVAAFIRPFRGRRR